MYDAIFLASRDLEYRDGRHVMVIVTDGGDTTSTKNYHQALEAAQMADAVMYPVLVMPITNDAGPQYRRRERADHAVRRHRRTGVHTRASAANWIAHSTKSCAS